MSKHYFECIDAHACGNPVRVVIGNQPELHGTTMGQRRQDFLRHHDWIRTGLMFEPRGHDAMSGSIIYPSLDLQNDMAILFIEVSGCLPMCGHGTIGTVTVAVERGLVNPHTPGMLKLETPAGLVTVHYQMENEYVESVTLTNVASFLYAAEIEVKSPELGTLMLDISYGGNFYAIIEPQKNYRGLDQLTVDQIRQISPGIRQQLNSKISCMHPDDPTITGVSHVMWTDKPKHPDATARNAVFYGDRGIDRSPCGTGTSARMAQLVARGDLTIGESFVHESVIGSLFTGQPLQATQVGSYAAIVPSISGWGRITGVNTLIIDSRDPYAHGFLLQ